ncbi:MAG: UPF0182 family protein [Desulfatiglandaceae bacterium]
MRNIFDNGNPTDQPPQLGLGNINFSKWSRNVKWILTAIALLVLLSGLGWVRGFYTDWLWFSELGHQTVLFTRISAGIWLFIAGFVLFVAIAAPNLYAAIRSLPPQPETAVPGLSSQAYSVARKLLIWVAAAAVVLGALFLAGKSSSQWENILLLFNSIPFDQTEPIFQKDFSFYVFTLPVLQFIRSWLLNAIIIILLISGVFYYASAILNGREFGFRGKIRTHLTLLATGIFVLIAAGHWLGRYDLLYSPTGAVYGVGFTDRFATLPARTILTFVALAGAALLVVWMRRGGKRLLVAAIGGYAVLSFIGGTMIPIMVQRFQVQPSEMARERPYLANNISFTRAAYGLEDLERKDHPARGEVDPQTVENNQGTIKNIRLWDEGPLLQSYNQIQFFRLYYDFLAVHTDRYMVDGELRQVMLATRELSAEKLPPEAQRWVNRHLQFTHGYGVAMSPVTEVERGGRPSFLISDVPPKGKIPLERPDVYYGLKSQDFLVVRSNMEEFNYPGPEGPVYTSYKGNGGVPLKSFLRKVMYAWQFGDLNILISGEIKPESRIQYRRAVPERFSTITPFLMRDREAYSVVADGRLFWIQDAYTFTNRYPYSTPWEKSFNYIRNSVKAVVDAYHGTVDYYVFDTKDPIIKAYQEIFPGLFKPASEMPEYLREHVRYPLDLFTVQTEMLLQYHMRDPVVFYNKEDQWSIPVQSSFGETETLKPYYIVAKLPDADTEEFLLIQPFTPNNRHNLVGWMAARSDGDKYGELVLFRFPSGRHVDGPNQVEARIDNDAVISEQFTLWGQVGSEVLRGILLVVPVGDSILYAEPVFLKPETLEFPELRRIILADSRQVVMHPTLDATVLALVGELPAVAPVVADPDAEPEEPAQPGIAAQGLDAVRRGLEEAVDKLQEVIEQIKNMSR